VTHIFPPHPPLFHGTHPHTHQRPHMYGQRLWGFRVTRRKPGLPNAVFSSPPIHPPPPTHPPPFRQASGKTAQGALATATHGPSPLLSFSFRVLPLRPSRRNAIRGISSRRRPFSSFPFVRTEKCEARFETLRIFPPPFFSPLLCWPATKRQPREGFVNTKTIAPGPSFSPSLPSFPDFSAGPKDIDAAVGKNPQNSLRFLFPPPFPLSEGDEGKHTR